MYGSSFPTSLQNESLKEKAKLLNKSHNYEIRSRKSVIMCHNYDYIIKK